jgi:hypothetical protein
LLVPTGARQYWRLVAQNFTICSEAAAGDAAHTMVTAAMTAALARRSLCQLAVTAEADRDRL